MAQQDERHQRPGKEFPGAAEGQVEIAARIAIEKELGRKEAQDRKTRHHGEANAIAEPMNQHQHQRKDEVELLLHRQAPGVQQRLQFGCSGEVAALLPEEHVRVEKADGDDAFAEALHLRRQHPGPGERQAAEHDDEQGGDDAPRTTLVEAENREAALVLAGDDDARDQIAADDEEHVDADEAAGKGRKPCMEEDDRDDGDGPQAINFGSVLHGTSGL